MQNTENNPKIGGRKRKLARQVALFMRREIPGALVLHNGDLERVSEDYGVAKTEVLAIAVTELLRRMPPDRETNRAMPMMIRRTA